MANKTMITMHIVAYLLIIIVDIVQEFVLVSFTDFLTYEIVTILEVIVYAVCDLIFGLIVNTIVTKIVKATHAAESDKLTLMNLETGSFAGSR
jgi:hypothetical protein